jgi:hypothetical protein
MISSGYPGRGYPGGCCGYKQQPTPLGVVIIFDQAFVLFGSDYTTSFAYQVDTGMISTSRPVSAIRIENHDRVDKRCSPRVGDALFYVAYWR